jgi:hypothetical protein
MKFSQSTKWMIKSRRMRGAEHMACVGAKEMHKERAPLEVPGRGERTILTLSVRAAY